MVANTYLEGTYSEVYPATSRGRGHARLFKQFSFPGGIPSHVAPETPGSIHEGGELGYSLSHAFGAAFDNPDLIVACVVGDGEAETGPLATSWHSNKFLNPVRDGAVLPILHLNGYKIANPTVLARISHEELERCCAATATTPHFVEGDDPAPCTRRWPRRWTRASQIRAIQAARARAAFRGPPALADDRAAHAQGLDRPEGGRRQAVEGTWRAHQVPLPAWHKPEHLRMLEPGCAATGPRNCSTRRAACAPRSPRWRPRASGA
jgi:xylulose-5-phosphate/fructose-6-phosphate phosphoketolase